MESPILDDRKWAKARNLECDMLLVDLEDTVPEQRKAEGRERAISVLGDRDSYRQLLVARPNKLSTAYGRDDIVALASVGVEAVVYPKLDNLDELDEVVDLFRSNGSDPDIFASIETVGGVRSVFDFAAREEVCAILFGPGDLSVDVGIPLGVGEVLQRDVFLYGRSRVVLAAAQQKIARITVAFTSDIRDLEAVRDEAVYFRQVGFTGLFAFYPPHLPVISDVFTPSRQEIESALQTMRHFNQARAAGRPAALENGATILIHDYERCLATLDRARQYGIDVGNAES
jgi:citrate lyase beta subunit